MATTVTALNHSTQQHARSLHATLAQQLGPAAAAASAASASETPVCTCAADLRQLVACNAKLARALASTLTAAQPPQQQAADSTADVEELQAACQQRQELLQELLQTLDSSVLGLRSQLDACHKLLRTPPCKEDPESIIRYAHTLRHAFAPLGTAPGLPPVPPAPQVPFMLHSTLRLYHMDEAARKAAGQQQQPQQPDQLQPPAAAPGATQPAASTAQPQPQQPAADPAAPPPAAAAAVAAPLAFNFRLNADMSDEEDEVSHETVSESEHLTSSSEDYEQDTE